MATRTVASFYKVFIDEVMGDKDVTVLPGISEAHGDDLGIKGYDKAYMVFGQYLILRRDRKKFKKWLKDVCPEIEENDNEYCFNSLKSWEERHVK